MTGIIDHRCSNYSHGIVSQNCLAKQYSDLGVTVKLVITGTFVQVHSIRDDDVLFCIVHDDMQADMNQMVCKRADIINVPENLWGPLFTVKKVARLSLVKDSKIAESIGNISVGHTVQVLGPDNSVICIANVTFRNSIGRLGVGIYFGLQVLSPRENLSTIIEKVSLLEPGTKGFPRGCDIVVTVDKILPSNCGANKWNQEKENQKQSMKNLPHGEDKGNGSFKAATAGCVKDKVSNNCKKIQHRNSPDGEGIIDHCLKKVMNSDNPLNVGDEVIYLNGDTPEKGVVRWLGLIENSLKVGVEFDNPIGSGKGTMEGLGELFRIKYRHALIVPPMALIKLSDYLMNSSKEEIHFKKNNCNSNNNNSVNNSAKSKNNNHSINNNNEYITSNDFCCSGQHNNTEEKFKKSKKTSITHQSLKYTGKIFDSNDSFQPVEKEEELRRKDITKTPLKSEVQQSWKSFDITKSTERKMNCRRNCNSVDSSIIQIESSSCVNGSKFISFPHWNCPHDYHDKQETTDSQCSDLKVYKCHSGEDDAAFQKISAVHHAEKNIRDFHQEGFFNGIFDAKKCDLFDWQLFRGNWYRFVKMDSRIPDDSYIPLPVIEQSILARKSNHAGDGDKLYDVPRRDIRRASCFLGDSSSGCKDSLGENFCKGHRHTLAPSMSHLEDNESTRSGKDKWGRQYSEPSNSDEHLSNYCEPSKPPHLNRYICEDLGKGSVVELSFKGEPHYGVIRWIGTLSEKREEPSSLLIAGVEMEEECDDFTDGTLNNKWYFHCNPRKALFVPLRKCRKDSRFLEESQRQSLSSKVNYGQIDCPVVEGTVPPINTKDDIELICGKNRGIQGHHNSCYLDATLFSMFAFTSVFDSLLYRPPTSGDIPQYNEVQRVLREEIVNPLRKNLYVRADRVMKLRTLLEELSSISGLTSEEKDPEEFLNSLLAQILKAEPFLKLSSGQEAFHYQLFVEKDERLTLPSVQLLFEQSFVTSDIKLKQVPSCLIIQMPRFGKSFKMYSRILPPHLLDITDIIENSPRQCTVCGKLAEYECKDCFGQQGIGNGLESISFCKACLETAHNHHCRSSHNSRALTVPVEFYELQDHCIIPRLFMELFAVVCIETSHYVAFVKCGSGSDAPWCFFDSMADRKGEQNGYNIPEMVPCPDLPYWLSEEGAKMLNEMQDERQLPEHAKRLFSDAYMCMYQSPDLMMYR